MRLLGIFLILLIIPEIKAQNYIDLARLNFDHTTPQPFDSSSDKTGNYRELSLDLNIPIKINDNVAFLSGLTIETFNVDLSTFKTNRDFYSVTLKIGANINHSDKWSANYLLMPKISSDTRDNILSDISHGKSKDFQMGGAALFKYAKNQNFNYKFGVFYNTDLIGPLFVPLMGAYILKDRFETNIFLPLIADFGVLFSERFKMGVKFQGSNQSYYQAENSQYLVKLNNEFGPYGQWSHGPFYLQVHFGTSIFRSFRVYEENDKVKYAISIIKFGDDRIQMNPNFKNGLFVKTSLFYRFQL
ncbi:DUF6268 family outer membrane beta-barrel protein [Marinoscillum sp. MHG1-6]|uniref:DUF6268 family outer membrane beta-barrel protein n=1 Tax=Marinoscillum sp. MHG1-6 TaxID=2959627 RepID=UPI0021570F46|nr:DUF6268 family outer membrane beta-barrel protein [Marinoscillum sp. MHG1-6]